MGIGVGFFRSPACEGEEVEGDAGTPHATASSVRYGFGLGLGLGPGQSGHGFGYPQEQGSDLGGQSHDGCGLLFGPVGPTSGPGRQVMRDDGPAGFAPSLSLCRAAVLLCDTGRSDLRRPRQKAKARPLETGAARRRGSPGFLSASAAANWLCGGGQAATRPAVRVSRLRAYRV